MTTKQSYLVLGATGSVGSVLARHLVQDGHQVMLAGRDSTRLQHLASELESSCVEVDAQDPDSVEQAVVNTVKDFGRIDGLANCIGTVLLKPAHLTTNDEWQETLSVNLTTSFVSLRTAAKHMRAEGGSIVLVSSAAASLGMANHEAIAAAKAGIIGLMLSAAATYANRGIRVNAVAPGLVKSNMTRRLWENETTAAPSLAMHALGRLGEPEDVASAIGWLLDPTNSWVTGQTIGIDGGLASIAARKKGRV